MKKNLKKSVANQGMSRREFLKNGTGGMVSLSLPALYLELFRSQVAAAEGFTPVLSNVKFIHIHLNGGALMGLHDGIGPLNSNLAQAGTLTPALLRAQGIYANVLANPSEMPTTIYNNGVRTIRPTNFGGDATAGISPFHNNLYAQLSNETRTGNQVGRAAALPISPDDNTSGANYSIAGMLSAAGITGELTTLFGVSSGPTGNGVGSIYNDPAQKGIPVTRIRDILTAGTNSVFGATANDAFLQKLADISKRLTDRELTRIAEKSRENVQAAYGEYQQKATGGLSPDSLNATSDADVRAVFGLTQQASNSAGLLNSGTFNDRVAHMVYNLMFGRAAMMAINLGGHDYHGNSFSGNQAVRQAEAGLMEGRIIELAARLAKRNNMACVILTTTDGGMSTDPNFDGSNLAAVFGTGDRSALSQAHITTISPGNQVMLTKSFLGAYQANGNVDGNHLLGQDERFSGALALNILSLAGVPERFPVVARMAGLSDATIAAIQAQGLFLRRG